MSNRENEKIRICREITILYVYGKKLEETILKATDVKDHKVALKLKHCNQPQRKSEPNMWDTLASSSNNERPCSTVGTGDKTSKTQSEENITQIKEVGNGTADSSRIQQTSSMETSSKYRDGKRLLPERLDETAQDNETEEPCIKFIGERNALIFNQAVVQPVQRDEVPDDFFDLTVSDAKILLRDAKRRREELENAPLLTSVQRKLDQDQKMSQQLKKYQDVMIRVQFPDQFVLQALFRPVETVQAIKDFIRNYLTEADCEFTIYTSPPKHILDPNARLIDENLIPSALVYYSGSAHLKPEIKSSLTDRKIADAQAAKARLKMIRQQQNEITKQRTAVESDNKSTAMPNTSKS